MPEPFVFLHTGDLHLDSPFVGISESAPPAVAAKLRSATLLAWSRIIDLAIERAVAFVVVAGDVFDAEDRTLRGQLEFAAGLERLAKAQIPAAVVTGNHDPLSGWEATVEWPRDARRFGAEKVGTMPIVRGGAEIARVYGISYAAKAEFRNLAAMFRKETDAPFAVGLLHGTVGIDPRHERYAPASVEDLVASGMDYWALGHIHRAHVVRERDPLVAYAGNPQGRDPGELEPHGVMVVSVDGTGRPTCEFVPTDVVRWAFVKIDAATVTSVNALLASIGSALETHQTTAGRSLVARIELTGFTSLHGELTRPAVLADLLAAIRNRYSPEADPFLWVESIRDETRSDTSTAFARGGDFVAEFGRLVQATLDDLQADPAPDQRPAPSGSLTPLDLPALANELWQADRTRHQLSGSPIDATALATALDDAATLAMDRLRSTGD